MKQVIALMLLSLLIACGEEEREEAPPEDAPRRSEVTSTSALEFPEGLNEETFAELMGEYHQFSEAKLAECPKKLEAVDEEEEKVRYPLVEELRRRGMIEEEDPQAETQEIRLTLTALSQLFGWTEDEDAYYIPVADREVVSIDQIEESDQNAVVRFKWRYVPREIGSRIVRGDAMSAEAKLVDEGDNWRVWDCKGLHPHLYNDHDRVATNQGELTVE